MTPSPKRREKSAGTLTPALLSSRGSHHFHNTIQRLLAASADPPCATAIEARLPPRSGMARQRYREASPMKPSRTDGGRAAASARPALTPLDQSRKPDVPSAAAVTAPTA